MILSGMKKENVNTFSWQIESLTSDPAKAIQTVQCGGDYWKLEINVQQNYKVTSPSSHKTGYGYVNTGNELVKDVCIVYLRKQYDLWNSTASRWSWRHFFNFGDSFLCIMEWVKKVAKSLQCSNFWQYVEKVAKGDHTVNVYPAGVMPFDSCTLYILRGDKPFESPNGSNNQPKLIRNQVIIWSKEMAFCDRSFSSISGQIVLIDEKIIDEIKSNRTQFIWTFRLSFTYRGTGTESKMVAKTKQTFVYEGTKKVLEAVETLLQDSDSYDVTLDVKGKTFKAHQCILKARVPVFKSMFQADMEESKTGHVVITDCDPVAFKIFLKYIYTGKLDLQAEKNAAPLYYIADKYDIQEMLQFCVQFMMSHWTVSCFFDYINIACNLARNGDPDLFNAFYKSGIQFVAHNFDEITSSLEWMAYLRNNPVGANELVRKAYQCLLQCA